MSIVTDKHFKQELFSTYKKKYTQLIETYFTKDGMENIFLLIPKSIDGDNLKPAEVLQKIKNIVVQKAFEQAVNELIQYVQISEDIIRDYAEYVNWDTVSKYQVLTEEFIKEFSNEVNWQLIFLYQELSEEFTKQYFHKTKIKIAPTEKPKTEFKNIQDLFGQQSDITIGNDIFGRNSIVHGSSGSDAIYLSNSDSSTDNTLGANTSNTTTIAINDVYDSIVTGSGGSAVDEECVRSIVSEMLEDIIDRKNGKDGNGI